MDKNIFLMSVQDKITPQGMQILRGKLENVSEVSDDLAFLQLKNPIIGLILGIFLGALGVDRYYQGNTKIGVAKLVLYLVGWITTFILIGFVILIGVGIWVIVDFFHVWRDIKQDNLNKILMAI